MHQHVLNEPCQEKINMISARGNRVLAIYRHAPLHDSGHLQVLQCPLGPEYMETEALAAEQGQGPLGLSSGPAAPSLM